MYGAKDVRTPNMQRLANAGVTFTHAFVASPSCAPSRAVLLTGLMPARNGAEANHTFKRDGVRSLTEDLKRTGYELAAFGKVAHGQDISRHGFHHHDKRHDAAFVDNFLTTRDKSKPLCLIVGTHEPHVPWPDLEGYEPGQLDLPPTHIDTPETREFRARYYTDVTKADTRLGEVYDLAAKHLDRRNTLFIYTSDHGGQWPFGKWTLYDGGIRVPFIAAWPGVIKPSTRSDALISWIDLLPTLIELAGGSPPGEIDGRSFARVLRGEAQTHRNEVFTTHSGDGRMNVYPIRSVRTRDWKYILNLHPEFAYTTHIDQAQARDGGYYWVSWEAAAKSDPAAAKIVRRYHGRPGEELYHLERDPFEMENLAGNPDSPSVLKELRTKLEEWMKEQGDQRKVFNEPRLLPK